jgi:RNA polymerase sigma factor (TIGR02999 family)
MPDPDRPDAVTEMLNESATSAERVERLLPLVYGQLRAVAERALAGERADHTLQATALVHEAYLRLVGEREVPWANRAHFYVAASEAMRRILLDHARGKGRIKRGGGRLRVAFADVGELASRNSEEILRFDEAFRRLEGESPEAAAVVRLRFFAGLSVSQTAEALGLSTSTVDRRWAFARSWLFQRMREHGDERDVKAGSGDL